MKKLTFILLILSLFPCLLLAEDYATYPWGIYSDEFVMPPDNENDYTRAKEAGIKWISMAALWNYLQETEGGVINWNPDSKEAFNYKLDTRVNKAVASNFNMQFFVAGFPKWIAEKKGTDEKSADYYKKEYPPKDDKFIEWKEWCKKLANRYKDRGIKHFEIYPEGEGACSQWSGPNYDKIFPKVINVIKYASEGIRQEISNALIAAPGDPGPFEYFKNPATPYRKPFIYHLEEGYSPTPGLGRDTINIASLHLYPNINSISPDDRTVAPEEINKIKLGGKNLITAIFDYYFETTKYSGRERRIYLTEQGYSVAKDVICRAPGSWVDEDTQADYIVRFHILALSTGLVDRIFYYMLRDDYPIGTDLSKGPSHTGLLFYDGSPRSSYYAYKTMANTLGDKMASHYLRLGEDKHAVVFVDRQAKKDINNKERIIVAWKTTGGSDKLKIPVNSTEAISYKDRKGTDIGNLTPSNGYVEVTLSDDSPVYIFDHSKSQEYNTASPPSITTPIHNTSFTNNSISSITGTAKASTKIYLFKAGKLVSSTTSDNTGNFTFTNVALSPGGNGFQVAEEGGSVSNIYNFIYLKSILSNNTEIKFSNEHGSITIPQNTISGNFYIDIYSVREDREVQEANNYFEHSITAYVKISIKDSNNNKISSFSNPLNITIPYDGTSIKKEENLRVVKLNDSNRWDLLNSPLTIDANSNQVSFSASSLSTFGLAEIEPSVITTTLSQIKVCPNPANLNEVSFITFKPIPVNTNSIKIFNLAGELIYTLKPQDISIGSAYWNATNEHNKMVSSGVYIFYLKTEDGKYQRGKFVIVK